MNKKIVFLTSLFLLPAIFLACGKKKYTKYKVYPIPEKIVIPAGDSSFITIQVEIPEDHHIYGNPKGPGTGKPTRVTASGHALFIFEQARFLPARKYIFPGESAYTWTYSDETRIFIPFKIKDNAKPGLYKINLLYESLLCDDSTCIPKDYSFEYPIKVISGTGNRDADSSPPVTRPKQSLIKQFKLSSPPGVTKKNVLTPSSTDKKKYFKDESFKPQYIESSRITSLIQAIIFGLIAGILLNFMPCVLPVVSLKVMNFVKHADKNRKELIMMGLLFSLGILTCFAVLATLAAFFGYNWGSLFQQRLFIVIMTGIIFTLALSMFHVFTINAPSLIGKAAGERTNHYTDAFVKGLLATLLATPCSGPFLGGTLAWTLSQPPMIIFIIFMSVGMGMALPYMILTVNPGFLRFIPRPGDWMKTFENIMGFLLIFTAVYLIGILDSDSVMPAITFLAFLSIAFWQYGKFGAIYQSKLKRTISAASLIIIITAGYIVSFNCIYKESSAATLVSSEFSVERLYLNKSNGRITIIKFTADWCPNCKLVEKISLYTPKVIKAIKDNSIELMTADITRKYPAAEKLLNLFGSSSIPFLAVMPAGQPFYSPICLRDIYTEDDVLKAIEMAKGKTINKKSKN